MDENNKLSAINAMYHSLLP